LVAQAFFSGLTRSFRFRLFGAARNKQGVDCHIHSRFWSTKLDSDRFLLVEGSFCAGTRAGMAHAHACTAAPAPFMACAIPAPFLRNSCHSCDSLCGMAFLAFMRNGPRSFALDVA
jgi:hypothetical protein